MKSPEGRAPISGRLIATAGLALTLSGALAEAPRTGRIESQPNPNQLTGIFSYGHREPDLMLASGNIADGFLPLDG